MKLIPLTQGQFAMVDDWNYEFLNQWKWYANRLSHLWYASRPINGDQKLLLHRQIKDAQKGEIIDHIDGNGLNCQRYNLRFCTHSQNMANRKAFGKSKYLGVAYNQTHELWVAAIKIKGKRKHLGYSKDENKCALLYNEAAIKIHGEFARLNIIK